MKNLDLTPLERQILERSDKPEVTRQRRTIVIASGLVFAAVLVAVSLLMRSWQLVLAIALLYIAITLWEKVAYANAVLAYKGLIRKLMRQLEGEKPDKGSEQGSEGDAVNRVP